MKKLLRNILTAGVFSAAMVGAVPTASALVSLPSPDCGTGATNNCLQFGDFSVYSLALLNFGATGSASNPGPGDPFYVKSSPGELGVDGYIVYGTGTNNNGVVTNVAGMDNSFSTPDGGIASFDTLTSGQEPKTAGLDAKNDPELGFPSDQLNYWNSTTEAIRSVLGADGQFVVYFNLNETGNNSLMGIDLLAWGQVKLCTDTAGTDCKTFTLTANVPLGVVDTTAPNATGNSALCDGTAATGCDNNVGDPSDPRWVYVHGTICAMQTASGPDFLHFGPCTAADPAGAKDLNQNLGANQAAFGIYNAELSKLIMDSTSAYKYLSLRYIFGQEDNGYEQLFSGASRIVSNCPLTDPTCFPPTAPEPGTLALSGLALATLAGIKRRKNKARAA